ncbi:MAG: ABC transporter permease [Oscillospiraceae bacterium]|nr:ABC transporter permease [Oscillospiraceae bacterium]
MKSDTEKTKKSFIKKILDIRGAMQVLTVFLGLILIYIVFAVLNDRFASLDNTWNLLRQIAPYIIIGVGQGYVLITANIDLSIGSVVGMTAMTSATLMCNGVNQWLALSVSLVLALLVGVLNGIMVAKIKLPPFIATLGTMSIARGIAQVVNNNRNTGDIGKVNQTFRDLFYYGKIGPIATPIIIALILFFAFWFLLGKTRTGRHIYAVGSNIEAAKLSGVNTVRTITIAYLVSSFLAFVSGQIVMASVGMGSMDAGNTYELFAVAAAVIGGISTMGGQGLLVGVLVGAGIWAVLQNGLTFIGVAVGYRSIIVGVIIVVSSTLDIIARTGGRRKKNN